jgi:hypothetical protein
MRAQPAELQSLCKTEKVDGAPGSGQMSGIVFDRLRQGP